jgi:hypothetical protein
MSIKNFSFHSECKVRTCYWVTSEEVDIGYWYLFGGTISSRHSYVPKLSGSSFGFTVES